MKKHITLFAALLLIFALILSACSGTETGREDGTAEPSSEPTVTENDDSSTERDNTTEQSGEGEVGLPEPSEDEENQTPDTPVEAEPLPEPDAFDHEVTQPGPGGDTADGGPQAASHIQSVAGVPLVRLNNGVYMPRFGLGTQVQSLEGGNQRQQLNDTVRRMVSSALESGYRHLDSAMFYYNERGVGWGIRDSGVPREEIWLTSKISGNLADAQNAFEGMLERLQVEYIDLVYIHHPAGTLEDILSAWRVMEAEYKAGRIRALGISNFDNRMDAFNYIMENAEIKPQVAQIECHPLAQRTAARELYRENYDIQVECWYPLNHNRPGADVDNDVLNEIAEARGKTVYQIILRWHMQEGLCPVPGSTNPDHILENISIFDFKLTEEEMAAIRAVDQGEAGRSFNLGYGDWGFGDFTDYAYDETANP